MSKNPGWCRTCQSGAAAPSCSALMPSNALWPTIIASPIVATADLAPAAALGPVKISGNSGQKDKRRRTKMRHPPCQEQRRLGNITRIEAAIGEEISAVVERHDDHNQAAQDVD